MFRFLMALRLSASNTAAGFKNWPAVMVLMFAGPSLASIETQISLQTAIEKTLANNPQLQVYGYRERALQGALQKASLRPALALETELENVAGTGRVSGLGGAELTVALSSIIELGDKRSARISVANAGRDQLQVQRQMQALDLMAAVTRAYIDVLATQERLIVARDAQQLAKVTLRSIKERVAAGATPEAELSRAKVSLLQAELAVKREKSRLQQSRVMLATFWGEREPGFLGVEGSLYQFGDSDDFDALYRRIQRNPYIHQFASEQRLREAQLRFAQTQARADIDWSLGVRRLQIRSDTALTMAFSMPLFTGKRSSGDVTAAREALGEVAVRRQAEDTRLYTRLYSAYSNRQQAMEAATSLQSNIIPTLSAAYDSTRAAYERGRYRYLEWVSARQELIGARLNLIDTAAAVLRYGADIEQLTAEPLQAQPGMRK
ncbi:TolC family protein [bacterium SCSIO 12696]|nr:TolC family protein [bacterium SCSIO 12696]